MKTSRRGAAMFEGEAWGLRAMAATSTLRVPRPLHTGALATGGSFLVMEHLPLGACTDQAALGRRLALMHAVRARRAVLPYLHCLLTAPRPSQAQPLCEEARAGRFGFPVDNTIGGTPQRNSWSAEGGTLGWVKFFAEQRLRPQCALTQEPALQRLGEALCARLPELFEGVPDVQPATLHGDLWSGNIAAADGAPVVFDPAAYYGARDALLLHACGLQSSSMLPDAAPPDAWQRVHPWVWCAHRSLGGGVWHVLVRQLRARLLGRVPRGAAARAWL